MKPTDALNSTCIGITTLDVSGNLSAHHQELLDVHRLWAWYIFADLMTVCYQKQDGTECHSAPGRKRSSNLQKCTKPKADVRLTTPDDGQKVCPKHVESLYQ